MWISVFSPSCQNILWNTVCVSRSEISSGKRLTVMEGRHGDSSHLLSSSTGRFVYYHGRESQQPSHFVNQPLPLNSPSLRPPRWPPPLRRPPTITILKRRGQTHRHCSHIRRKWQWGSARFIPLPVCHTASQHTVPLRLAEQLICFSDWANWIPNW